MIIYMDLETFGNEPEKKPLILPTESDIKVGNIKDPAKIKAKIDADLPVLIENAKAAHVKAHDDEWRSNATKSTKLTVICMSYAIEDSEPIKLIGTEKDIFGKFEAFLLSLNQRDLALVRFVAHYGNGFDFPITRHRAMKYGYKRLFSLMPSGRYSDRCEDTLDMFRGSDFRTHYSLDSILKFFGLEGKGDITGADVHDMYLDGKIEEIASYCASDVIKLRQAYKKIKML